MFTALAQASLFAQLSIFMGLLPFGMGLLYAIRPTDRRLNMMRPLSLANIFAAVSGTTFGLLNVARYVGITERPEYGRVMAIGLSEAMVPIFIGFGCLAAAWLCVAIGFWRKS